MDKRAGDIAAAALSARKLAVRTLEKFRHAAKLRRGLHRLGERLSFQAVKAAASLEVFRYRETFIQQSVLKHRPDSFAYLRVALTENESIYDHFAFVGLQKGTDNVDCGGFSRAVRTEKSKQLAFLRVKVDSFHRLDAAVRLFQPFHFYRFIHV